MTTNSDQVRNLGIDIDTGSLRVVLLDDRGAIVSSASASYDTDHNFFTGPVVVGQLQQRIAIVLEVNPTVERPSLLELMERPRKLQVVAFPTCK